MATLGIGAVGSGLDVESIVRALVDAVALELTRSIEKEVGLSAELSAVGKLKTALTNLSDSLIPLSDGSAFDQLQVTSSSNVTVTQTGNPAVSDYSLDINSLATSQVLASPGFASSSTVLGTGTLTLRSAAPLTVRDPLGRTVRLARMPQKQ